MKKIYDIKQNYFARFKEFVFLVAKLCFDPNRLVAFATFILAFFTYQYIEISQKMVEETKNLAAISQEQFKIKSYPFIYTEVSPFTVVEGETIQKLKIVNRGEIPAFRLSAMILHGYGEITKNFRLKVVTTGTYKIEKSDLNYNYLEEYNIPSNDLHEIAYTLKTTNDYDLKDLNFLVVILKFKVPYDNHFKFQTKIYKTTTGSTEKPMSNNIWSWTVLNTSDQNLVKSLICKNKILTQPSTQEFLSGYGEEGNEAL